MNALVKMILTNWLTSIPGGSMLAIAIPELMTLVQSGTSITEILQSPALAKALAGVGLLLSKDMNVTGGKKNNA